MKTLNAVKEFLAYTWFMYAALVGSFLMFRYVIMLPLLKLTGMEPLFHTGTEIIVSAGIAIYWIVPGVEAVKNKKNKFSLKKED